MTGKRRQRAGDGSHEPARPVPDNAESNAAVQEPARPVVRAVRKKIGEGRKNLRDRVAAFDRRHGQRKRSD
jgi:hypothetical protein